MEELKNVCKNPWCKATFVYKESDMVDIDGKMMPPTVCSKCKSFDTELSGGVSWSTKEYDGSRFDGMPHQIKYKVTNYK
jgi:hypothetical protein